MECAMSEDQDVLIEQIKGLKGENDRFVSTLHQDARVIAISVWTRFLFEPLEMFFCCSLRDLQSQTAKRKNIICHAYVPNGFSSNTRIQNVRAGNPKKSKKKREGFGEQQAWLISWQLYPSEQWSNSVFYRPSECSDSFVKTITDDALFFSQRKQVLSFESKLTLHTAVGRRTTDRILRLRR